MNFWGILGICLIVAGVTGRCAKDDQIEGLVATCEGRGGVPVVSGDRILCFRSDVLVR